MILLLVLQSFETTRLDVPVVGRPTIGGFHDTRVDVPVIGRPATDSAFHRGWSLATYRSRLTAPSPMRIDRRLVASASASPAVVTTFLQPGIALSPPAMGGSATAAVGPAEPVCELVEVRPGIFEQICR